MFAPGVTWWHQGENVAVQSGPDLLSGYLPRGRQRLRAIAVKVEPKWVGRE
jgi:hypothetical protein